jgi:hypothetical protein
MLKWVLRTGLDSAEWICQAQDRGKEWALTDIAMNVPGSVQRVEQLRLAEEISASQERLCFRFCVLIL